uniref:Mitochondrial ribosomal protein S36 n=1 Tax=Meloidogyne javanica TaxID=6303 RepID=A0A915LUI7_MELJA
MRFVRNIQNFLMENSLKLFESFLLWSRRSNTSRILKMNDLLNKNISELHSKQLTENRLFATSSTKMAARKPMIKFLGRRSPQPKFDPSISTTLQQGKQPNKNENKLQSTASIEFYQLPERYKPKPLSEQEIQIINSGGCPN